jgi:hypothetical protein
LIAATAAMLLLATDANPAPEADPCLFSFDRAPAPDLSFDRYAVRPSAVKPHPLRLDTKEARMFRTAIRRGLAAGVNFSGGYTLVNWGCGASCLEWAVVNVATGKVYFDPARRTLIMDHVDLDAPPRKDGADRTFVGLIFRRDSSLLVLQGAPNEDPAREGITYLRWTGRRFEPLRFIPASKACGDKD